LGNRNTIVGRELRTGVFPRLQRNQDKAEQTDGH
jgi:hypothetical protein